MPLLSTMVHRWHTTTTLTKCVNKMCCCMVLWCCFEYTQHHILTKWVVVWCCGKQHPQHHTTTNFVNIVVVCHLWTIVVKLPDSSHQNELWMTKVDHYDVTLSNWHGRLKSRPNNVTLTGFICVQCRGFHTRMSCIEILFCINIYIWILIYGYYVWQINLPEIKETDTITPLVLSISGQIWCFRLIL